MPKAPKPLSKPWIAPKPITDRWAKKEGQFDYQNPRWRKVSKLHRVNNPLCTECYKKGRAVAAQVTDHIHAIEDGGDPWDKNNLQSLCESCHNTKSVIERNNRNKTL